MDNRLPKTISELNVALEGEFYLETLGSQPGAIKTERVDLSDPEVRRDVVKYLASDIVKNLVSNVLDAAYIYMPIHEATFHQFSKLPQILQTRIWHHAISIPHIVDYQTRVNFQSTPNGR